MYCKRIKSRTEVCSNIIRIWQTNFIKRYIYRWPPLCGLESMKLEEASKRKRVFFCARIKSDSEVSPTTAFNGQIRELAMNEQDRIIHGLFKKQIVYNCQNIKPPICWIEWCGSVVKSFRRPPWKNRKFTFVAQGKQFLTIKELWSCIRQQEMLVKVYGQ